MSKAKRMYTKFHGRGVRRHGSVSFHEPESLVCLGAAVRIEYLSDKFNGGGDGRKAVYYHDFKPGAKLYTDESGKQLYILARNGRTQVNERGIIS